jgi:hypothetical protein
MSRQVLASEVSEESSNSFKKMQRNSMHYVSLPSHTMRRVGTPITLSGLELEIVRLLGKQNALKVVTTSAEIRQRNTFQ